MGKHSLCVDAFLNVYFLLNIFDIESIQSFQSYYRKFMINFIHLQKNITKCNFLSFGSRIY